MVAGHTAGRLQPHHASAGEHNTAELVSIAARTTFLRFAIFTHLKRMRQHGRTRWLRAGLLRMHSFDKGNTSLLFRALHCQRQLLGTKHGRAAR